jgi:hypothetical protein
MNKFRTIKTNPVTQKVILIVSSMLPQLEAIGTSHQGLMKCKATEIITSKTSAITNGISF